MSDTPADVVIPGESLDLIGQVMRANARFSEDIANRVEDNYQRNVDEWKEAFLKLYVAVENVNEVVDSKRVDDVLFKFGQKASFAAQPSWWKEKH